MIERAQFIHRVRQAAASGTGFAAGKIGNSEQFVLGWPIFAQRLAIARQASAARLALKTHAHRHAGIFPDQLDFIEAFRKFYADRMRQLDALGLFGHPGEPAIIAHYRLKVPTCRFSHQEPGRQIPDNPADCYLPAFAGKRVLLISSFAELLAERARRDIFEAVWSKTGKRWFAPASVEALVMPYSWNRETQLHHGNSIALFDQLCSAMAQRRFDLALIGAGALGVPLAVHAKALGAVGISLGGHLQVLFGVLGRRWRDSEYWQGNYINDSWVDLPPELRPDIPPRLMADRSAYW